MYRFKTLPSPVIRLLSFGVIPHLWHQEVPLKLEIPFIDVAFHFKGGNFGSCFNSPAQEAYYGVAYFATLHWVSQGF